MDGAPAILCSSIRNALQRISIDASSKPIYRTFLIGGASLYTECLDLPAGASGFVDRILLTRVAQPAFDDCDVFMPNFDAGVGWRQADHEELVNWVGSAVPVGVQEEGEVKYEFQMWVRNP